MCAAAAILLLVCFLIFRRSMVVSAEIYDQPAVDSFFAALADAEASAAAARAPGGRPSSSGACWQPNSSVIVTVANFHHVGLALMQFRRLTDRGPGRAGCGELTRAVVAVDTYVSEFCRDLGFRREPAAAAAAALLGALRAISDCPLRRRLNAPRAARTLFLCRNCVLGTRSNVGASDYRRSSYHALTYLKWRVARSALLSFDNVIFFGAGSE